MVDGENARMPITYRYGDAINLSIAGEIVAAVGAGSASSIALKGRGELRNDNQAEANIAIAVAGGAAVTISRPTVLGIVAPAPATKHKVRAD